MKRVAVIAVAVASVGSLSAVQKPASAQTTGGGTTIPPKIYRAGAYAIWSKWTSPSGFTSINSTSNLEGTQVGWDPDTQHYSAGTEVDGTMSSQKSFSANIFAAFNNPTPNTISDGIVVLYADVTGISEAQSAGYAASQLSLSPEFPGDADNIERSGETTVENDYVYDDQRYTTLYHVTLDSGETVVFHGNCNGHASYTAP